MELTRKDYYGILQLPFGASEQLIRRRYKRLALRFHPDVNAAPDAADRFRKIQEAYAALTDPESKRVIDAWYTRTPQVPPTSSHVRMPGKTAFDRPVKPYIGSLVTFGCFGLLTFVAVVFGGWLSPSASVSTYVSVGILAAVVAGLIAASGTGAQERILWLLRWLC